MAWPVEGHPLRAAAEGLVPHGPPESVSGTAWTATVGRGTGRGAVWLLGSHDDPRVSQPAANWKPFMGSAESSVTRVRKVLHQRYGQRMGEPLGAASVEGGWLCWSRGPAAEKIEGESSTLAAALALFSSACGVRVKPDRVAMANVGPSGRLEGVDESGLPSKLAALRALCSRPPVLMVARQNVACADAATQQPRIAQTVLDLEERSPAAADSLVRRVFDIADLLAAGDIAGPERLLDGGVVVRSWPVAPYRLYYQVDAGRLLILRVYHHARRPL